MLLNKGLSEEVRRCSNSNPSQVFVVGWSLDILDVWLLWPLDASVGQFLVLDWLVDALTVMVHALPVPSESAGVLQAGHLLVSQISDDLQELTTVSVLAEDALTNH